MKQWRGAPEGRVDYCADTIPFQGIEAYALSSLKIEGRHASPWPVSGLVGSNPAPGAYIPQPSLCLCLFLCFSISLYEHTHALNEIEKNAVAKNGLLRLRILSFYKQKAALSEERKNRGPRIY